MEGLLDTGTKDAKKSTSIQQSIDALANQVSSLDQFISDQIQVLAQTKTQPVGRDELGINSLMINLPLKILLTRLGRRALRRGMELLVSRWT